MARPNTFNPMVENPVGTTLTVGMTTLKEYTLECYHQGFNPTVWDLNLYTQNTDPEGVALTGTTRMWVALFRAYRKGIKTRKGMAPYGMTHSGIYDPLWDALIGRGTKGWNHKGWLPR